MRADEREFLLLGKLIVRYLLTAHFLPRPMAVSLFPDGSEEFLFAIDWIFFFVALSNRQLL